MSTNQPQSDDDEARVYYHVDNSALGEAQPGDVVSLQPSVADAYSDNLTRLEADTAEAAREEAEDLAQSRGEPAAVGDDGTVDFDADAGTFVVQDSPVGGVQPGETVDLSPEVAAAFQDNLRPATDDGDEADADATADEADGDVEPPVDPDEYTVDDFETHVEESDYSEAELDALAEAEEAGKDRDGVAEAIAEARNGN